MKKTSNIFDNENQQKDPNPTELNKNGLSSSSKQDLIKDNFAYRRKNLKILKSKCRVISLVASAFFAGSIILFGVSSYKISKATELKNDTVASFKTTEEFKVAYAENYALIEEQEKNGELTSKEAKKEKTKLNESDFAVDVMKESENQTYYITVQEAEKDSSFGRALSAIGLVSTVVALGTPVVNYEKFETSKKETKKLAKLDEIEKMM